MELPAAVGAPTPLSRRAWLFDLDSGEEHLLTSDRAVLGREPSSDVALDDESVSRRHAVLAFEGGGWSLLPEVTSNGTLCNGRVVQPGERLPLRSTDTLQLGSVRLMLVAAAVAGTQKVQFAAASRAAIGTRQSNGDAHWTTDRLLAVADGVGDGPAGSRAARAALDVVARRGAEPDIVGVVAAAHGAVLDGREGDEGGATTLDVVRLLGGRGPWSLQGAHVGDGWVFLHDDTGVSALTTPDRLGARAAAADPQAVEELAGDPDYDRLASALGYGEQPRPQVWVRPVSLGQRVVLTSDGLPDALGADKLIDLLSAHRDDDPDRLADLLMTSAAGAEARDNVTVVVADVVVVDIRDATVHDGPSPDAGAQGGEP